MAGYALKGYTTPTGVSSSAAVKELQRQLGVKADGIWGPKTDAAYNQNYQGSNAGGNSHATGYDGSVVTRGNDQYTPYGAYIRSDTLEYPGGSAPMFQYKPGARISPNGMYQDVGRGWEYAGYAAAYDPKTGQGYATPSSMYGARPGTSIPGFENIGAQTQQQMQAQPQQPAQPEQPDVPKAEDTDEELQRYWNILLGY